MTFAWIAKLKRLSFRLMENFLKLAKKIHIECYYTHSIFIITLKDLAKRLLIKSLFIKHFTLLRFVKENFDFQVFNPIQDGPFRGCSRMGGFLAHLTYNDETWHSSTLPKEDPKSIQFT